MSSLEAEKVEKNVMDRVRIEKVVVHMSIGNDWDRLQKAARLLESLTGQKPVFRKAKKTIRAFGIVRKRPTSVMVTLRKDKAIAFLKKALEAVDNKLKSSSFDEYGNFSFGIQEHLQLPGTKYDPEVGIFGMDVTVHLTKPGYRVKVRRYRRSRLGKRARVSREEAIKFVKETFGVEVE